MAIEINTVAETAMASQQNSRSATGSLNDFISLVKTKGLASHNLYMVTFDIPRGLQGKYSQYGRTMSLLCAGGELPAVSMITKDIYFQGATRPVVTNINFSEMFLFFYLEASMELKTFFDDWFNLLYNAGDGTVGYPDDCCTQIRIYQLDKMHVPVYAVELINVFPKASFPLQITAQGGQLHRLPISWTYRYWHNIDIQYSADKFWGNILQNQGASLVEKLAPSLYNMLA